MAYTRKILLADPEGESTRALSRMLRQRGFQVSLAADGSRALEMAVLRHPDLILFDEACPLLEARTFLRILRSNPRTAEIPVVFTSHAPDTERLRGLGDGFLRKPFNLDEVLARLEQLFRRVEAAQDLKGEAREIEGSLAQLSLPDLLQVFAMNRRTGRLQLNQDREHGELHLSEGRIVHAQAGIVEGDKALYRLMAWTQGNFSFTPSTSAARSTMQRNVDELLLESMRQLDESARLLTELPPRHTRLELSPSANLAEDQHPVTAQVVELLRIPHTLGEVLDSTSATDLDVLAVLRTLLEKNVARVVSSSPEEGPPLLQPAEVHALRTRLFRTRLSSPRAIAKVLVAGVASTAGRKLLQGLRGSRPMTRPTGAPHSGFGTLVRYEAGESLELQFLLLPAGDAIRPLWRPLSAGAVAGILLDASETTMRLGRFFAWESRIPLAILADEVPSVLQGAPAGIWAAGNSVSEALRAVLVHSLVPVATSASVASEV